VLLRILIVDATAPRRRPTQAALDPDTVQRCA